MESVKHLESVAVHKEQVAPGIRVYRFSSPDSLARGAAFLPVKTRPTATSASVTSPPARPPRNAGT